MNGTAQQLAEDIFRRKDASRKLAAGLPVEEKLRRLVAMQQRANEVRRAVGRPTLRVWEMPESLSASSPPGSGTDFLYVRPRASGPQTGSESLRPT